MNIKSQIILASAGTGKTFTLIDRILYLLLINNSITRILVITFTNAAIEEIHERLHNVLTKWQNIDDNELKNYIKKYNISINKNTLTIRAKSLLQEYLENINKVQIKTIHSFSTWFLSYIGFDQINHFTINTEINLSYIKTPKEFYKLIHFHKEKSIIRDIIQHKYKFKNILDKDFKDKLYKSFNLLLSSNSKDLKIQIEKKYREMTEVNKSYIEIVKELYTQNMELKKNKKLVEIQKALDPLIIKAFTLAGVENTIKMSKIIFKILKLYNKYQKRHNMIDYNDIIEKTKEILNLEDKYYLYQIYNSFDHILIDEAQDTSISQWQILFKIIEEIEHEEHKSFFIVGDSKQSIFSFQGSYQNSMQELIKRYKNNETVEIQELNHTYRNSVNIINLVNNIFSKIPFLQYQTTKSFLQKGNVQLILCDKKIEDNPQWPILYEYTYTISPEVLAIYDIIQKKITENYQLSDIMIIVQKRNTVYVELINYLKLKNIRCSDFDKELLKDNKFIKQILYICEFVLNNDNDFALLKIIETEKLLSFRAIEDLCINKSNKSLWSEIKEKYVNLYQILNEFNIQYSKLNYEGFIFYIIERTLAHKNTNQKIINKFIELANLYHSIYLLLANIYNEDTYIQIHEENKDKIQILTSHGSKGLEAKVIILADTKYKRSSLNSFLFFGQNLFLWNHKIKGNIFQEIKNLDLNAQYEEYVRLLYVAITRAKTEIFAICNRDYAKNSWADLLISNNSDNIKEFSKTSSTKMSIKYSNNISSQKMKDVCFSYKDISISRNKESNQKIGILMHKILNKILELKDTKIYDIYFTEDELKYKNQIEDIIEPIWKKSNIIQKALKNNNIYLEHKIHYEKSYIQIDLLIFEDQKIYIVDFKLRYNRDQKDKYKNQLNLYQKALEHYFNQKIYKYIICFSSYQDILLN